MKIQILPTLLMLTVFAFGCGLTDRFKAAPNANVNAAPTSAPSAAVSATPTAKASTTPDEMAELGRNLLAFGAGTNVVAFTSESHDSTNKAVKLIDESAYGEGWKTNDGQAVNQSVTLEFPARTTLEKIVFDTYYLGSNKNAPKDVRVEISDVSIQLEV